MDKNMTLEKRIAAELYSYQGKMSVFVDDLHGHTVEIGADEEFETASTIKAFILAVLYLQVSRGRADLEEEITYEASQFVDGSGMLRALGVGAKLKVKDTATMMIICSDNIATNMIIDYLRLDTINACIRELGFGHTVLHNPLHFDRYDKLGTTTPRDYAALFAQVAKGTLVSKEASAAMLGIDNILCLTGDHTKLGDHPQAKPVFDLDSVSLLHTASLLETGKDLGGNDLVGEPPKFAKGAVVSPCSDSVDAQLVKMERKVAAGAEYFQTQAVFEPEKFIKFMEKAKQFGKPVQVGIIIPKSAGMAKFMNNNVAGIHVPDEMIEELKADKEKTKAGITGVEIAARIIKECKPYCQGVHIMALGWESKVPELLKQAEI